MRASPGILVAGGTADERAVLAELLEGAGYRKVWHAPDVTSLPMGGGPYDVVVVVAGTDGEDAARAARQSPALNHASVLLALRKEGWGAAAGGDDVLHIPTTREELETRIDRLVRSTSGRASTVRPGEPGETAGEELQQGILDLLRALSSVLDASRAVREALDIVVEVLDFDRASLVMRPEGSEHAFVAGATDDPTLTKYVVKLAEYPELDAAFERSAVIVIDDVRIDLLMKDKAAELAGRVGSLAVFPLLWRGRACGALFLRAKEPGRARLSSRELTFAQIVAGILAQYTEGGHALDEIAEQTRPVSIQRFQVEQRHRAIERLSDYFESASDGIVVLCGEGRILFMNRAAEGLTGFSREGLLGQTLADLVPENEQSNLARVVAEVVGGTNLEPFDLGVATSSGDIICVSVTTSTILSEHVAAILSFRDVTAERALEGELRNTKEFLEKLIDSTVDAIVAADLEGRVILFNPGAERLFGWRADEVLGHLSVEQLYPTDIGRQIMRMLRSASYGGVGRLETIRREVTTKDSEIVPVNMTASIVYDEEGREVATVGILSDLRERIRIEKRLLQAQEKLATTEKQALVSELAGATAHELNQPLTSVIGYAELLRKKLGDDSPLAQKADIIISEAARMADIVRKIGKITRYETKSYVGSTQILDLDKATGKTSPDEDL